MTAGASRVFDEDDFARASARASMPTAPEPAHRSETELLVSGDKNIEECLAQAVRCRSHLSPSTVRSLVRVSSGNHSHVVD